MITVHHLNNSRSHRILWLLEELGLDFEIEFYRRNPKTMLAPDELKKIHPLGKSPVVTDGDRVLAESGAIIEYLVEEHGDGRMRPEPGGDDFLRYRYWLHYAEGSAMSPLLLKLVFTEMPGQTPFIVRPLVSGISAAVQKTYIDPQVELHVGYWNDELAKSTWFVGDDFTAADIQMSFALEAAETRADLDDKPNIRAFLQRIRARPAYARAIERGGAFQV